MLTKKWTAGVLIGYVLIILGETVLFRKPFGGQHFQPQLFWSYEVWDVQKKQIIANVLLFIPLGFLVGSLWKWKGGVIGVGFSVAIELLQLISNRGLFEFDDILLPIPPVFFPVPRCTMSHASTSKHCIPVSLHQ